ncbi:PAS domain-containing sensor histidine kinase [Mangrovibacterium sp.]|uniref:sensor histidine kinase n=1 Tax=Mangrovibacterium sp. TaxID=1961364 RepID=UPI0035670954
MISKHLYFRLASYIAALCIIAIGTGYYIAVFGTSTILFFSLPLIFLLAVSMLNFLNKTNRRMAYFIDAIRNDDTSLQLPKDIKGKSIEELYGSLRFLNEKLKQKKIDISYKEQLLETLIENLSVGFITIDEDGNFEVLNHNARCFLGIEYTSNLNRLRDDNLELYHQFTKIKPGENRIHRQNGKHGVTVLSISAVAIKYRDKSYKIISLQDISRELDEQELAAWHKLFRVITHEIMNSIAPITSLTKKLSSFFTNEEAIKNPKEITQSTIDKTVKGLNVIDDMSNGLINFVNNFRQLNKVPTPKISRIEVTEWLLKLKFLMQETAGKEAPEIFIKLDQSVQELYADENLINQVFINLFLNSQQALNGAVDGKIGLTVVGLENGRTEFSFSDNGQGISSENMEKVFIPFFSTKENGNGIGLSLSKQIIRLHGGQLTLQSEPGKGTIVTICI